MTVITYSKPQNLRFNKSVNGNHFPFASLYRKEQYANVPVNITETEDGYQVQVVAPGMAKEDFKISLEQDQLTISAESTADAKENEKIILREYNFTSFRRSFTLSENIDAERISANYVNGVLTLNLGRKDAVKPPKKEITIL